MRDFERDLKKKIASEIPELSTITPGLSIEVFRKGEIKCHLRVGETYPYYDLASLTKILFMATAWMRWVNKSNFDLSLPAYWFLPWWRHKKVSIQGLMTHSAGLSWWRPYYRDMKGPLQFESRWAQLAKMLTEGRPHVSRQAVYSDLDLFVLGFLIEELEQKSLPQLWNGIAEDFGLEHTHFNHGNRPHYARKLYAPTETCAWRRDTLQGEVHDENAWSLGGIAPHAGLFAPIHDVSKWALALRKAWRGEKTPFGSSEIVQQFTKRQLPRTKGDWGYLFMKPSIKSASCGRLFSKQSFGHTGFTGTSVWMDPVRDVIVVILSNRVHPTRKNSAFLQLRPRLHEWICELL